MPIKEVSKKFNKTWGKYDYDWNSYSNISNPMKMYCKLHGSFELTPIAHYRRDCCPQCQELIWIKEALDKNWTTIEYITAKYKTTNEDIKTFLSHI